MFGFGKSKKKQEGKNKAAPDLTSDTYRDSLLKQKAELMERIVLLKGMAHSEAKEAGFWAAIGGLGIVADMTFLGGIGTCIVGVSSAGWAAFSTEARRTQKKLKNVEKKLQEYEKLKDLLRSTKAVPPSSAKAVSQPIANDFKKAVVVSEKEVEAAKNKLAELEKKMGEKPAAPKDPPHQSKP